MKLFKNLLFFVTVISSLTVSAKGPNDLLHIKHILNKSQFGNLVKDGQLAAEVQSINRVSRVAQGEVFTSKYSIASGSCSHLITVTEKCPSSKNYCYGLAIIGESKVCTPPVVLGHLKEFKDGVLMYENKSISRDAAYDNCKSDIAKLANSSIKCVWNDITIIESKLGDVVNWD